MGISELSDFLITLFTDSIRIFIGEIICSKDKGFILYVVNLAEILSHYVGIFPSDIID